MLKLHSDRLDYREILSPPPKYKAVFAVGTTYSLDLETLTATCAIIGLNIEADTEMTENPLYMLEAIRKASGKLLLFCQGGQIKSPDKPNRLLPLIENCVCEINMKNKKSFHPKTWFIRYSSVENKPDKYRLIVLSRNLTFDRSWDIAICINSADDGESVTPGGENTGAAMRGFLMWLSDNARFHNEPLKTKREQLTALADAISGVSWADIGKGIDSFDFIPFGIDCGIKNNLVSTFHKILIISPFISKSVIEGYAKNRLINPECTLITRKSELPKLGAGLLTAFDTYTVKDDVVDGEECLSETSANKQQDIHAKLYLKTKWSDSEFYIGSANASYNALYGGNIECMLVLFGKKRYLNTDMLKAGLGLDNPNDKNCPFERIKPNDYTIQTEDTAAQNLETAIKEFCAAEKSAVVSGRNPYTITAAVKLPKGDVTLTISPLMKNIPQKISETLVFTGLVLRELSEWYKVTASINGHEPISRVIKIPTAGIPETRDSAVFSDIIKDKNAFLTYIAFLLSDDYLSAFLENLKKNSGDYRFLNMSYDTPVLYERMLKTAAHSPENLREVREVIKLTGDKNVPQDFFALYKQFEKAVKK